MSFDLVCRGVQRLGHSSTRVKGRAAGTAASLAELARKTLHACKYPRQTGQFQKDVGRRVKPKQTTLLKQLWSSPWLDSV